MKLITILFVGILTTASMALSMQYESVSDKTSTWSTPLKQGEGIYVLRSGYKKKVRYRTVKGFSTLNPNEIAVQEVEYTINVKDVARAKDSKGFKIGDTVTFGNVSCGCYGGSETVGRLEGFYQNGDALVSVDGKWYREKRIFVVSDEFIGKK